MEFSKFYTKKLKLNKHQSFLVGCFVLFNKFILFSSFLSSTFPLSSLLLLLFFSLKIFRFVSHYPKYIYIGKDFFRFFLSFSLYFHLFSFNKLSFHSVLWNWSNLMILNFPRFFIYLFSFRFALLCFVRSLTICQFDSEFFYFIPENFRSPKVKVFVVSVVVDGR